VLLETHHAKAVLSALIVKVDRKNARGIAQLLRDGWWNCPRNSHNGTVGARGRVP